MLLLLLACTEGKVGRALPDDSGAAATDSSDAAIDSGTPVDADGDGADLTADCDDGDPSIHPGAAEVCDGHDQDCDGVPDDGIPTDGAGCVDPGPPAFPDPVTSIEITLGTGSDTYWGTDDPAEVCLGADLCWGLDIADWNDREVGQLDVHHIEGVSVPRADIDRFEVRTSDGGDMWVPTSFEASLNGQPVYCQQPDTLPIGTGSGETPDWTDPAGLGMHCTTAWPAMLTHGPMIGATLPDSVHLWYRTDATRQVQLRVAATASALTTAAPVHYGYPAPEADFTEEVVIRGLTPESTWVWDLEIDGVRFGPWQFTSAPESGASGVRRFAFGSCTAEESQPGFGAVLAYDPDVYLFIGDNHYGNTPDLGTLRQWYRWAHSRPLRADLLHQSAILATWDDHDYVGNNTDGSATGKDNALRAFDEYWANDGLGTVDTLGVFHRESWGDVDLYFIDDRYWRGLEDSITGNAQEAWLIDAVTTSSATFKLVVSGSQWTAYGSDDSWATFPEAQQRVLDAFTTVAGVVLLSGDVHRSEFRLLTNAAGYPVPEITASAMAYSPMAGCTSDPDVLDCYNATHSWVTLDVDTLAPDPVLVATIRDESGLDVGAWTILASTLAP